jgi:hypothetical protein
MKNLFKVFILSTGLILCFNVKGYADSDSSVGLSAWGGFAFMGNKNSMMYENNRFIGSGNDSFSDMQLGVKGQYYLPFSPEIVFGLGGFFQQSNILDSGDSRKSLGADLALIWVVPDIPNFNVYLRLIYSFYDKIGPASGNGFGFGSGYNFDLSPEARFFIEFMFEYASHEHKADPYKVNNTIYTLALNFGVTYLLNF